MYPDSKGSSWVQSLVNLKSELFVMPNGYQNKAGSGGIARFMTRRDLQPPGAYDMRGHWTVILLIVQKQDAVDACMGYRSSPIRHDKAESLFSDFKQLVRELASGEGNIVDKLLT